MKRFYYLSHKRSPKHGVARTSMDALVLVDADTTPWARPTFELEDGEFCDYPTNENGWPLCSERLRRVVDDTRAPDDEVRWLPATIVGPGKESRGYFVLDVRMRLDCLDRQRSIIMSDDRVVKPVLDLSAIGGHRLFSWPGTGWRYIAISEEVREAIAHARCTGVAPFEAATNAPRSK